ncbi:MULTISPECIES: DUF2076 family protein [unclassified Cupriavidus]|uniref:DUF2076 family protein n=1 Tax=unclassified Cupriavidus TaxID=2640874 RepID=UPI001C004ECA|nr:MULTISPECIES: DUF2076 family protein [unclassified Cupriavidus]MCA3184504.1 DUF2076 family protein [Cupriavidus sp.]MCA3188831.1 DUF2076 family protein [Cupriavidus sp.]MCA3198551.1 DUF2076 family protein [Cupriavidus sp.]MCA3201297.1 DUF2076 family protein [Cupriavidus sp.]MCA3206334.1 DUF2076 family protein [Cupriavidus sp.]
MTPQDVQALETFLSQLTQARVDNKDAQAAAMIADAAARQPDTAYLLVQRSMLLDRALQQAQAQIQTLQTQLQAAQAAQAVNGAGSRGFMDNDTAWGNSAGRAPQAAPAPQYPPQQQYPSAPQYQAAPAQPAQAARPGFLGGGLGGTLGSIATTAAGVAGGAMLFQGIENLFHRGGGGGGFFGGQPAAGSETVINNFYGDDNANGGGQRDNALLADNGNLDNGLDDYVDAGQDDDSSFF